ncbi:hypothetical protein D3C84_739290 [compost metagenome]
MLQVGQLTELAQVHRTTFGGIDPGARDHGTAQVLHDFGEANVAGGFGDQQMKAPVRFDTAVVVGQQALIVIQRFTHLRQLQVGAARCRQRRRLGFQAHAQLQNTAHPQRRIDIQPQPLLRSALDHKRANPMPGFHQPRGLQLRDRLAHHRATDPVFLNDGVFRRQLVAGQHLAEQDALGQFLHQVMGQVVAALAGRCFEVFLHGRVRNQGYRIVAPRRAGIPKNLAQLV